MISTDKLDDQSFLKANDPKDALGAVCSIATQVKTIFNCDPAPVSDSVSALFVGIGGSGAAGLLCAASPSSIPIVVQNNYELPGWVRPRTYCVASSYSGNTDETLRAFEEAKSRGATEGFVVTTGGRLAEQANPSTTQLVEGGLLPRYAVGLMTCAPVELFRRASIIQIDADWQTTTSKVIDERLQMWGPDSPTQANDAKKIALASHDSYPVIWGWGLLGNACAYRIRCDINENAKVPARSAMLPELCHNEIVGVGREGAQARPPTRANLLCLRTPNETPRSASIINQTLTETKPAFESVIEITSSTDIPATTFLEFALLGGLVSLYLAALRGVDPSTMQAITQLKESTL